MQEQVEEEKGRGKKKCTYRGQVFRGSTKGKRLARKRHTLRKAKIRQLQVPLRIYQQVLWLEIPVDDVLFM